MVRCSFMGIFNQIYTIMVLINAKLVIKIGNSDRLFKLFKKQTAV
jgi:hypothetical protein